MMIKSERKILNNLEKFVEQMEHSFELTMEDFTIIQNALHYYKKSDKRGKFTDFTEQRINLLRDKLSYQLIPSKNSKKDW